MTTKKIDKRLLIIAASGFAVRALFILFLGKFFFGKTDFLTGNDTSGWTLSIETFFKTGTYTFDFTNSYGYFARMPGYSFFTGLFYLLISHDWEKLYPIIAWTQIIIDTFSIIIIYHIGEKIFLNKKTATILSILYAFYPFIIVWTPVVYSESTSIFLLLAAVYYFLSPGKKYNYCISGLLMGLCVLFRPQVIPIVLLLCVTSLIINYKQKKPLFKNAIQFILFFLLSYSPWPIRNYVNYKKIIFTQDLRGFDNWNPDVISFMQYIYSVKAEWEPQFTQIITNDKVVWPKESYITPMDSAKLSRAVYLSQNCGRGFSEWIGYWKGEVFKDNCDMEIKQIFDQLREEQMEKNSFNFWIRVPLQNLRKAIFKTSLVDNGSLARKVSSLLFIYRTILIFAGLLGCFLIYRSKLNNNLFGMVFLAYFVCIYVLLCTGTSPQMRDIEIRYFLPADVLMLIPASFLINITGSFFLNSGKQKLNAEAK